MVISPRTKQNLTTYTTIMTNFEIFESLGDFSRALNTRPVNDYYKNRGKLYSRSTHDANWYGTPDYHTADELLLNGDKKNAAKIQTALNTRLRLNGGGRAPQSTIYNSVQGFVPNMGRLMSGHPENMLNIRRNMRTNSKVVTIMYNDAASCGVRAKDLINAGAKLLAAVKQLERSGYRCNIYIGFCSRIDCQEGVSTRGAFVKVKDAGGMLDVTRLAYTFVNPSFFRRHMFAFIERMPGVQDSGYGRPSTGTGAKNTLATATDCGKLSGAYYVDFSLLQSCTDTQDVINTLIEYHL